MEWVSPGGGRGAEVRLCDLGQVLNPRLPHLRGRDDAPSRGLRCGHRSGVWRTIRGDFSSFPTYLAG